MRLLAISAALIVIHSLAVSATIYVPDDYSTIQEAIDASSNGETIIVRPGTYVENIDFKGKAISVRSEQGAAVTTIDGSQAESVVMFRSREGPDSILAGFTLANGEGQLQWWPDFTGGGITCDYYSSPTITNNVISGNSAAFGCGIYCNDHSSPTITNNIISDNLPTLAGGGIYCSYSSSPTIANNTISGHNGGGIYCFSNSSPTIMNNVISGNSSYRYGGAIACQYKSSPSITNNTITGNSAWDGGGAIACFDICSPTITNTILWKNSASSGKEIWVGGSSNPSTLSICHSDIEGGQSSCWMAPNCTLDWGAGMIDADPLFAHEGKLDFHLTWQSPCREAGDNASTTMPTDFEGDPRISLNTADIGADEFYYHLYHDGVFGIGLSVDIKVVGAPTIPVLLGLGAGIQDPPQSTQYGDLFLLLPLVNYWQLGNIPGNGILTIPVTVPVSWNPGQQYPFQALVGPLGNPGSVLTNLMAPVILKSTVYVPDDRPTIQQGIDHVADGGVVIVRPGTYVENISFRGKAITVTSEQGAAATIIEGNQEGPVVSFVSNEENDSVLDGFTITNGYSSHGGGVKCYDCSSPTIINNRITGNVGPGIGCNTRAAPIISKNIISENSRGIDCDGAKVTISDNIISSHTSNYGAGIFCNASDLVITNNVIANNTASKCGGGIYCDNSTINLTNNTIMGNSAGREGGGILCKTFSSLAITNTIMWNNSAPVGEEAWIGTSSEPSTLTIDYSDLEGGQSSVYVESGCTLNWGTGMIDAAPLFAPGPMGDYYLSQIAAGQAQDSPCVDTGDPGSTMIIGTTRTDEVQDSGVVDMGFHYRLP